jgi:hypothetical protein
MSRGLGLAVGRPTEQQATPCQRGTRHKRRRLAVKGGRFLEMRVVFIGVSLMRQFSGDSFQFMAQIVMINTAVKNGLIGVLIVFIYRF